MKRRITVTLDCELVDWLDKINESDSRDRSRTLQQYVKLAKRALETDEIQYDAVTHIAFEPTRKYLLQDNRDTTATILQFPGVAR
jgi:metal-responsive CopG/Arc/MetJ family transcriptional regulator